MAVDHLAIQLALRTKLLTTAGLPSVIAFENHATEPVQNVAYLEEDFVPASATVHGLTSTGVLDVTGLYVLRWYALANTDLSASNGVDAVLSAFRPGTTLPLLASDGTPTGDVVRIRMDVAPYRGPVRPAQSGYVVCTITIPWRVYTLPS